MARILVTDDEEGVREFSADALEHEGHTVVTAETGEAALGELARQGFDLVMTDLRMPGIDGVEVVRRVKATHPYTAVIVLTAYGTVDTAVEAMKLGAYDYLQKPVSNLAALRQLVARCLEARAVKPEAREPAPERERETPPAASMPITWGDPAMAPVVQAIGRVAATMATVLLLGESGTGKSLTAQYIHARSNRAAGPFVSVNCAALPEQLLESELFGHEKGSFTGAHAQRRGRIEMAEGGTFFLDEIGELKPELQAKLLRVLESREFERVGGAKTLRADVRWVAATNRDLQAAIREGRFRQDLFHRLAVFPLRIPALRERRQDVVPLAEALLGELAREQGRPGLRLGRAAAEAVRNASWPGNVRELRNVLERAVILSEGDELDASLITSETNSATQGGAPLVAGTLEDMEVEAIRRALAESDGNRKRAAEKLGIGLRTLYDKLKRYNLG